jgi:hypothetical protein
LQARRPDLANSRGEALAWSRKRNACGRA